MIHPVSRKSLTLSIMLLSLLVAAGCASKGGSKDVADDGATKVASGEGTSEAAPEPPETKEPTGPSLLAGGKTVGNYVVSLNTDAMEADVADVAETYDLASKLDEQLRGKNAVSSGGDLEVEVTVVNMRLRTNSAAIWAGIMAGPDWITTDVNVKENGKVVKTFQTKSVTTLGGFGYGGRGKRMERMINDLGNKVIAGL